MASTLSPDDPPKVIDPPELELLKNASKAFDSAAQAAAANVSKASNDSSLVSLKNIKGMDVVQKIEKSDQDAFIGANALSMVHGGDDNETDMLSLKFVTNNKDDYLVCAKSDGVRYLMFVTSDGKVYLNDRKCQYFEVKTFIPPFFLDDKPGQNTRVVYIFDGELILNSEDQKKIEKAEEKGKTTIEEGESHAKKLKISLHYLIFDTLMHSGEHCILKKYLHRLEFAKKFVQKADYYTEFFPEAQASLSRNHNLQSYFPINFYLKDFYTCRQIEFLLNSVINKNVLPHENDGLIFTKNNYPYFPGKNRGILKWKPSKLNTIDFFVTENIEYGHKYPQLFEDGDFQVLELYTIYGDYMHFMDFLFVNQEKYIERMSHFRNYTIGKNEFNGIIVECNYDHNLVNSKFIDFLDLAYEASSDGVEKIIKNSRLYLEWEQKTNLTLETNKKNWGIMREKLLGEIQQKEKDLQCIKNHDERDPIFT